MKLFSKQLHKKKAGFTMMELLMVIAIIVILVGISVPAVGTLRRNLRQRELDSKAEVIYTAAQSRLTQLRTGGYAELYGGVATEKMPDISKADYGATVRGISGLHKDILPADAVNDNGEAENLCYVVSEEGADVAYVILPQESVDKELWNNHWIIEFDPTTGTVYAVFYGTDSILARTNDATSIIGELDSLRSKPNRLSDGARVGYYGGDLTQINVVDKDSMTATLKIINKEELTLDMTCVTAEKPTFRVTVQDTAGNKYVKTLSPTDIKQVRAGEFHATWTLDSLKTNGSFYRQTEGKLLCGTDITVRLDTSRDQGDGTTLTDYSQATTNSLFAYRGDYSGTADTAYIAYGRHLQNLDDNTSHVLSERNGARSNVTKAVQVQDISFLESTDADSYYVTYGDRLFTPIHNQTLTAYAGQVVNGTVVPAIAGLHIESEESNVGLFSTFAGTIQDLRITGPKIRGGTSNVGTLMGSVLSGSRKTEIRNVQVYLSEALGDLPAQKADSVDKVTPWLTGRNVGGLIGSAASNQGLTIVNSSASLPIKADRYAGGLVGTVNGSATIYNTYADCYLVGNFVGGLIGGAGQRGNIILQNFYAAGYGLAKETAAGIVTFDPSYNSLKNMTNGYSVMSLDLNGEDTGKIYALAPRCVTAARTYYMPQNGVEYELVTIPGAESMAYEILSSDQAFGYERTNSDGTKENVTRLMGPDFQRNGDSKAASYPYNLMEQGLNRYSFPKLNTTDGQAMNHYGDWLAQFEEGALVYFEKDEQGNYRFEGGNISVDQIKADASEQDYTKRTHIVADGYALAYTSPKGTTWDGTATLGGKTVALKDAESITVANYTLYRLPADMLNNDTFVTKNKDTDGSLRFYQTLTVMENGKTKTYSFNPSFASCFDTGTSVPEVIRIRSPRQLYALSRLYSTYAPLFSKNTTFRQELDLDYTVYNWNKFYVEQKTEELLPIASQEPIGTDIPFFNTYDGRNNTIEGVSILTEQNNVGLFGATTADGSISNLVLLGERVRQGQATQSFVLRHKGSDSLSVASGLNQTVNMGALVGLNKGKITNCAVSGYQINLAAYTGVTVNIGGLAGRNDGGSILSSSAETPKISLRNYAANTYAGGFVGDNSSGTVTNCYAAAYLEVREAKLQTGNVSRIAGFAAKNGSGNLLRCYAGSPLMASGDTEMYGFVCTGGSTIQCYYLDGGTYEYRGSIYSLNASENGQVQKGTAINADNLSARTGLFSGYGQAAGTYLGNDAKTYPYPEAVTRNGQYVHFGQWPNQDKDVGTFGVFYWEYESGGNSGYHLTFQGTADGQPMQGGSTLCTAHDDGGVITKYGYGYFYKPTANLAEGAEDPLEPTLVTQYCELGAEDEDASRELQKQMPQYKFVAYQTGLNGLRMTGTDAKRDTEANRNAIWKLCYPYETMGTGVDTTKSGVYTYSVSPFFGDAYNLVGISKAGETDTTVQNGGITPGAASRTYQVRNVDQLQFINWNYWAENATSYISAVDRSNNDSLYNRYPYLSYGKWNTNGNQPSASLDLYWVQSHDVNGANYQKNYTPIGSMFDDAAASAEAHAIMAFFSSSYDGQAYTIKNISIDTDAQCIGIFGVTAGAKMKNMVLYSDNGSQIIHGNSKSWYSVGGIAGIAGSMGQSAELTNCTVSGYTILDRQSADPGWGGGCIGGLVGTTTMNLARCTAVSTITLERTYTGSYQNLRVGGLVGCARGKIESCYAGGSIRSTNGLGSSRIWVGGILGGIVLRNEGNLQKLIGSCDGPTTLSNCYSFVDLSNRSNMTRAYAIGSNGEMLEQCYPVDYDYIVIRNCYAYSGTSQGTDDYAQLKDGKDSYDGINLNRNHNVAIDDKTSSFSAGMSGKPSKTVYWSDRRVELRNARNPFLSYKEMKEQLLGFLNGGGASFDTVTVTENSASITGKYSFPGGDTQLEGMNYPFPTILTQTDVDGNTVNVHYGPWPKFGIYWEEHKSTLDLLADRNTTGVNLLAAFEEPEEPEPEKELTEEIEEESMAPDSTVPETAPVETQAQEDVISETAALEAAAEGQLPEEESPIMGSAAKAEETVLEETSTEVTEDTPAESTAFQSLDAQSLQAMRYYTLYVVNIGQFNVYGPYFELLDEEGKTITQENAAAVVLDKTYPKNVNSFSVPILAKHPGTVIIRAWVIKDKDSTNPIYPETMYEDYLTVTVTADLKISVEESLLPLKTYVGDSMADLPVSLVDTKNNAFTPGTNAELEWTLAIDAQESENDLVTWTKDGFLKGTEAPFYLTSLKGFSAGEGSLKLTLVYTWDASDGVEADPVETSVILPIEVLPSDVLGLGDGTVGQEAEIPHTPTDGTFTGAQREDKENIPTLEGQSLFLYASNETDTDGNLTSYTDLSKFRVTKAELKRGGGYQEMTKVDPQEDAPEPTTDDFTYQVDEEHTILFRVDRNVVSAGDRNRRFTYRPITVEGDLDAQWTLRLTLQPVDGDGNPVSRTYILEYDRPNTVTFAYEQEDGTTVALKAERVEQGGDLGSLDQDDLDEELERRAREQDLNTGTAQGQHDTWTVPTGTVTRNLTVTQQSVPIRYYVNYYAGYPDYEWDDNVPMEKDTFTYGQEGKRLKANAYNRPGYEFAGWAVSENGEKLFDDGQEFTDEAIFHGEEYSHNRNLNLYAVWTPKAFTISYNGNYDGWDAEGAPAMENSTYSIDRAEGTLRKNTFVRPGYTFLGWAYESGKTEPDLEDGASLDAVMRRGGEYVVYSNVTLYAVWQQESTDQVTDTLETPDTPKDPAEAETEAPEEPAEEPEDIPEEQTEPTEAPTEPEPEEETEPPQAPEKEPEEEGDTKETETPEE